MFNLEKKALSLGKMNGLEKSYCLREIELMSKDLETLQRAENELQEQYEQLQIQA